MIARKKTIMFLNGEKVEKILYQKDFKPPMKVKMEVAVQSVYDGDTFTAIYKNNVLGMFVQDKFRLARINASEMKKPRGITETEQQKNDRLSKAIYAKDQLAQMISGKKVYVTPQTIDPYNRIVCEVDVKVVGGSDNYLNISTVLLEQNIVEPYLGG